MFGLLNSVLDLAGDVVTIVTKPIEAAVDLAGAAVKPLAEAAKDIANDIKSIKD